MPQSSVTIIKQWLADRGRVARSWVALSFAISLFMFISIWIGASYLSSHGFIGEEVSYRPLFSTKGNFSAFINIFLANVMVLGVHFFACVGAYLVNKRVNHFLENRLSKDEIIDNLNRGEDINFTSRQQDISHQVGRLSIVLIASLVIFSITRQIIILSTHIAGASQSLDIPITTLMARAALHAFLELTAIFLPLAADLILSKQGRWQELLAGAWFSLAIAIPMLLLTAAIETWVTGGLFQASSLFK